MEQEEQKVRRVRKVVLVSNLNGKERETVTRNDIKRWGHTEQNVINSSINSVIFHGRPFKIPKTEKQYTFKVSRYRIIVHFRKNKKSEQRLAFLSVLIVVVDDLSQSVKKIVEDDISNRFPNGFLNIIVLETNNDQRRYAFQQTKAGMLSTNS